jgi:hypothetical protein
MLSFESIVGIKNPNVIIGPYGSILIRPEQLHWMFDAVSLFGKVFLVLY